MRMINIPQLPSCRYKKNSDPPEASAEAWRDDVLIPALQEHGMVQVMINPKYGMPVSWCEEAFGGVVRKLGASVVNQISFMAPDHFQDDAEEARQFMQDAATSE